MTLPFKLSAQSAGAQKAYERFVAQYGKEEGERIYLAYAEEHGSGKTVRQKVNSVFHKGANVK